MRPLIATVLILLFAGVATAVDPDVPTIIYRDAAPLATEPLQIRIPDSHEACRQCQPARPGTWAPIHYSTPLRNFLFGSARFQPDPNYRWQPGQWVPVQPPKSQGATQ